MPQMAPYSWLSTYLFLCLMTLSLLIISSPSLLNSQPMSYTPSSSQPLPVWYW